VNVDQEPLDFEPWALPGAGGGVRGSVNGGAAHAGLGGFAAPHGPHSCSGVQRRVDGAPAPHCSAAI